MGTARQPAPTVAFVDGYCAAYRDLFADVRSFEHLSLLHIGLISDLPRKSLPAIGGGLGWMRKRCIIASPTRTGAWNSYAPHVSN